MLSHLNVRPASQSVSTILSRFTYVRSMIWSHSFGRSFVRSFVLIDLVPMLNRR